MPKAGLDDISLYYEVHGKGEPLLLIAGLGADSAAWTRVVRKFAERFKVITFDNRGSGRSDIPDKKYSIREMAEDAAKLLDHLRVEKTHVIGHSMGGYIAQEFAICYPKRVDTLILEATAPISSGRNNMLFSGFLRLMERKNDVETLIRQWSPWLFSPRAFERGSFVETFIKNVVKYPYPQTKTGFRRQLGAIASFDTRKRIKNIKARTLVMAGRDDILITSEESRVLSERIPGSLFAVINDAGHDIHVESPAAFISEVAGFLGR